jgi:hypothetical protein
MKINAQMNLSELAQHMGDGATTLDAENMRTLLVESEYEATADISDKEWVEMLDIAVPWTK